MFSKWIFDLVYEFFQWIFDALGINVLELPIGIATMVSELRVLLTDSLKLVAWLFPPGLWTALVNLTFDCLFIMLNIKFLKWGLNMYNKIRHR